jgi:hypothetical protein
VRALRDDFADAGLVELLHVLFRHLLEQELVADAARGIAVARLVRPEDGELHAGFREECGDRARRLDRAIV